MTTRTASVLERPAAPARTPSSEPAPVRPTGLPVHDSSPARPLPRGWGSHEERRLMLWGVVGFFLLGAYAAVFVVIGAVLWS